MIITNIFSDLIYKSQVGAIPQAQKTQVLPFVFEKRFRSSDIARWDLRLLNKTQYNSDIT